MMLCLDCGNTRLKWGLLDTSGNWQARDALALNEIDRLGAALAAYPAAASAIACNVAGVEIATRIARQIACPLEWVQSQTATADVRNGYRNPGQLGADRWVALIAARGLHAGACLVVNAGTATTIDLLQADGYFAGGLILPGLDLMRQSLARNTAGLPLADAAYSTQPTDTDSAIVSGTLEATVGAIERMHARLGDSTAPCLLAGGAAPALQPLLRIPVKNVDDLVLRGLARIVQTRMSAP